MNHSDRPRNSDFARGRNSFCTQIIFSSQFPTQSQTANEQSHLQDQEQTSTSLARHFDAIYAHAHRSRMRIKSSVLTLILELIFWELKLQKRLNLQCQCFVCSQTCLTNMSNFFKAFHCKLNVLHDVEEGHGAKICSPSGAHFSPKLLNRSTCNFAQMQSTCRTVVEPSSNRLQKKLTKWRPIEQSTLISTVKIALLTAR